MTNGQTQKAYKVLKIDELTKVSDTGTIERYYRYQFKTKGGTVLTADLSEANSTPEKADAILTKKAENFDKLLAM